MANYRKKIIVLGSTGSVGTQALKVVGKFPDRLELIGISANTSVPLVLKQLKKFKPRLIAMTDEKAARELKERLHKMNLSAFGLKKKPQILVGEKGLEELAATKEADIVLNAVVGSAGIRPTFAMLNAAAGARKDSKTLALANKETLVAAGDLVMDLAQRNQVKIIPVDSEHSAIFQCLMGEQRESVLNLVITCSGGPFRATPKKELAQVTVKQALKHPSWSMGGKITIDSATLMNKGLEVIEAHFLFGFDYDQIKVLVHPQSLIHSLVEFRDGSLKAQIGETTMKVPIQLACSFPDRWENITGKDKIKRIDLSSKAGVARFNQMQFFNPDFNKFTCLKYAYEAGRVGGTLPAVLNAANEAAVEAFLTGNIKFTQIAQIVKKALNQHQVIKKPSLNDILELDQAVKQEIRQNLNL